MKIRVWTRQFLAFSQKEFYHILRDRKTLLILVVLPLVQLLIFGFALNSDLTDTPTVVLDFAGDAASRRIAQDFDAGKAFQVVGQVDSREAMDAAFRAGEVKAALVFPPDFEEGLKRTGKAGVQLILDASFLSDATMMENYARGILLKYQRELLGDTRIPGMILPEVRMMYNPQQKSAYTFVPGVIGIVLMLVCALMASLSLVREKESGTMEVLLVSPVRPFIIIISKVVPYLAVGMVNVVMIILVSVFVLQVPVAGNVLLLFGLANLFTLSSLALGILVSALTATQKNAVIVSIAGLMLPAILLSGFIFPLDGMSAAMRGVTKIIPATWFISAAKLIMIKGLGFGAVWGQMAVLAAMTAGLLIVSIKSFKERLS